MKKKSLFIVIGILLIITIGLLFIIFNVVEVDDGSGDDFLGRVGVEGDYECSIDNYNCEDFESYEDALNVYDFCGGIENDIHGLDNDLDGEPCEGLKRE